MLYELYHYIYWHTPNAGIYSLASYPIDVVKINSFIVYRSHVCQIFVIIYWAFIMLENKKLGGVRLVRIFSFAMTLFLVKVDKPDSMSIFGFISFHSYGLIKKLTVLNAIATQSLGSKIFYKKNK